MRAGGFESGEERALSAEELLVESQLVAMGLLEAREQVDGLDGGCMLAFCAHVRACVIGCTITTSAVFGSETA